jgi:hypothetical protein
MNQQLDEMHSCAPFGHSHSWRGRTSLHIKNSKKEGPSLLPESSFGEGGGGGKSRYRILRKSKEQRITCWFRAACGHRAALFNKFCSQLQGETVQLLDELGDSERVDARVVVLCFNEAGQELRCADVAEDGGENAVVGDCGQVKRHGNAEEPCDAGGGSALLK